MDFHGRFSTAMARRVARELEPYRPLFIEEPVLPEYAPHRLRDVVEATTIPVATGERIFDRAGFLPVLQAGIGVAQPDVAHCGGISEALRIASPAGTFAVAAAPPSRDTAGAARPGGTTTVRSPNGDRVRWSHAAQHGDRLGADPDRVSVRSTSRSSPP